MLPEMFATGFSMNAEKIGEAPGHETEQFLSNTAKEFSVCLMGGAAMRGRDGLARNKALVFSPSGELLTFYAKMQPFVPGGEAEHYTAGEKVTTFRWADFVISPFICYDVRFPEIFREAALLGPPLDTKAVFPEIVRAVSAATPDGKIWSIPKVKRLYAMP